jgi:hypothetical protein
MATLRFAGFPVGANVSVDALQGAETASATVAAWRQPVVSPTLSINTTRASVPEARTAPEAMIFEANPGGFGAFRSWAVPPQGGFYDAAFHEIHYEWDFGDNRAPWTAARLPAEFNQPSKGYGRKVGHVYVAPGVYQVRCTARQVVSTDPLEVRSATTTTLVQVADPEVVFDPSRTVVVALDGDFTGAPASNYQVATTAGLSALLTTLENEVSPFRVLLKRGENYQNDADSKSALGKVGGNSGAWSVAMLGAWGDPADPKPVVPLVPFGSPIAKADNVHLLGDYDPLTDRLTRDGGGVLPKDGANNHPTAPVMELSFNNPGWKIATNVDVSNTWVGISVAGGVRALTPDGLDWEHQYVFADNCAIDGSGNYTFFGDCEPRDFICLRGCGLRKDPNQVSGPVPPNPKIHGGFRTLRRGDYQIDGCDFFSRGGWSGSGAWVDGVSGESGQPTIRLNGNLTRSYALNGLGIDPLDPALHGSTYISRNVLEGAGATFTKTMSGNGPQILGNDIVERNLVIGAARTAGFFGMGSGATTIRGNVAIKPAGIETGINLFVGIDAEEITLDSGGDPPPYDVPLSLLESLPVQVYSNTVVALYNETDMQRAEGGNDNFYAFPFFDEPSGIGNGTGPGALKGPIVNKLIENNVIYAPDIPQHPTRVDYAADTTVLFEPRYLGRKYPAPDTDNFVMQTQFATPLDTIAWYMPTDPLEMPAVTGTGVHVQTIKGDTLGAGDVPVQGAHAQPVNFAPQGTPDPDAPDPDAPDDGVPVPDAPDLSGALHLVKLDFQQDDVLWQDTLGGTPATADGDPVKWVSTPGSIRSGTPSDPLSGPLNLEIAAGTADTATLRIDANGTKALEMPSGSASELGSFNEGNTSAGRMVVAVVSGLPTNPNGKLLDISNSLEWAYGGYLDAGSASMGTPTWHANTLQLRSVLFPQGQDTALMEYHENGAPQPMSGRSSGVLDGRFRDRAAISFGQDAGVLHEAWIVYGDATVVNAANRDALEAHLIPKHGIVPVNFAFVGEVREDVLGDAARDTDGLDAFVLNDGAGDYVAGMVVCDSQTYEVSILWADDLSDTNFDDNPGVWSRTILGTTTLIPEGVCVIDIDGDGVPEVFAADQGDDKLWVFKKTLGGTTLADYKDAANWTSAVIATGLPNIQDVHPFDHDDDGTFGIIASCENTASRGRLAFLDYAGGDPMDPANWTDRTLYTPPGAADDDGVWSIGRIFPDLTGDGIRNNPVFTQRNGTDPALLWIKPPAGGPDSFPWDAERIVDRDVNHCSAGMFDGTNWWAATRPNNDSNGYVTLYRHEGGNTWTAFDLTDLQGAHSGSLGFFEFNGRTGFWAATGGQQNVYMWDGTAPRLVATFAMSLSKSQEDPVSFVADGNLFFAFAAASGGGGLFIVKIGDAEQTGAPDAMFP